LLWSAGEFPAAARLTGTHAVSAALLMIAVACGLRDGDAWTQASVWLAMVAVFVRLGVPPLHAWVGSAMSAGAWATRLSVLAIVSITSIAALARWPGFMPIRADAISGMAIVGASILLWGVLAASGADRVTQVARGLWVGLIGLLIVQVANHQPQAMLLTAAALIAPIGLALIARSIERRFGHDDLRKLGGLSNAMPSLMAVALPSTFLAASAPGSPGFAATLATMIGSARVIDGAAGVTTLTLIALSYIVLTLAIVRMTRLCFFGPGPVDDVRQHPSDLRWWEIAGVSILLAIALIAGLMPALVLLPGNS
jgi:formate hydrogenlyase subunit 3/multisubunit Na+/H+ antiporter MnhD subunit